MVDRLKLSLGGVWMIAGLSALILPIFLPSFAGAPGFTENAISLSAFTMFLLSFPSSLVAIPMMSLINPVFSATTPSISVAYIDLLLLFGIGYAQWFWIIPRLFGQDSLVQRLDLRFSGRNPRLFTPNTSMSSAWVDADGTTPLERVLEDRQD